MRVRVLLILVIIGLLAHYPSLNLGLYGDDWLTIYLYFVPQDDPTRFGPLPGLLSFLTPYGPAVLLIGILFNLFHTSYFFYYLVALALKILATFCLYLVCQKISKENRISFLVSTLFLVGLTGLQTTDWVFYMNIYLAISFYLLGTLFQIKFLQEYQLKDMWLSLILTFSALVVASLRLFPLILIFPLMNLILYFKLRSKERMLTRILSQQIIFIFFLFIFWGIGLFGGSFMIYSYGGWSVDKFLAIVFLNLFQAVLSYLHWIGALLIPDNLIEGSVDTIIVGIILVFIFIISTWGFVKDKKNDLWFFLFGLNFFIFLSAMWYYWPSTFIDSAHRYLQLVFVVLLLWLTAVVIQFIKAYYPIRIICYILFMVLIFVHFLSTWNIYKDWLNVGRDSEFIKLSEAHLINKYSSTLNQPVIIYLDVDDARINHSIVFGLGFKIMVFTKTWDKQFAPFVYDDAATFKKNLLKRLSEGQSKESLLNEVYAYKIRNKQFIDITSETRQSIINW